MANALPLPLASTNLSLYLVEHGFDKASIALFSLLSFPMSLKLIWCPVIDHFSLPFFKNSPRKGWLLFSLLGMSIVFMLLSQIDPAENIFLFCVLLSLLFSMTGCLYMVGISYELECLDESRYSKGSSYVIIGYRTGLLLGGAAVLSIAHMSSWEMAFFTLSCLCLLSTMAVAFQKEPSKSHLVIEEKRKALSNHSSLFYGFLQESFVRPCRDFFSKQDAWTALLVILFFKLGIHTVKLVEGPFYLDLGFTKQDLAIYLKTVGFTMTILGSFISAYFFKDRNVFQMIAIMSLLHSLSLSGYLAHAFLGKSTLILFLTSVTFHFTGGMAMATFIRFLWKICSLQYASAQYACLMSLFSFNAHLFSFLGGLLAAALSWQALFMGVIFIAALSSSLLLWICREKRYLGKLYHDLKNLYKG